MSNISYLYAEQRLSDLPETSIFALIDGLQYERFYGDELVFKENVVMPLFDKYPDSRIAFAGPWMIKISEIIDIRELVSALELELPSVSWLVSKSTLSELIIHFQNFLNVELPDGQVALLRLQDPRVQIRLGEILNGEQHRELTHLLDEWVTATNNRIYSVKQREYVDG
ncbi:DUF4123 domain-containing protein [Salmonella enterica subsp. enterica]|nr:DUF4123 domain-containing protein [Salmonella enterica subsp. enterica]